MAADGSGARPLVELPRVGSLDWHPDGSSLLATADQDKIYLVNATTGQAQLLGSGTHEATWSPDGRSVYYWRQAGPDYYEDWGIVEGDIEDGTLVENRTVLAGDQLDDTILADVGLRPGLASFALAVGPCG